MKKSIFVIISILMMFSLSACTFTFKPIDVQYHESTTESSPKTYSVIDNSTNELVKMTYNGPYSLEYEKSNNGLVEIYLRDKGNEIAHIGFAKPELTFDIIKEKAEASVQNNEAEILDLTSDYIEIRFLDNDSYQKFLKVSDKTIVVIEGENYKVVQEAAKDFTFKASPADEEESSSSVSTESNKSQTLEDEPVTELKEFSSMEEVVNTLIIPSTYEKAEYSEEYEDSIVWEKKDSLDTIGLDHNRISDFKYYTDNYPDGKMIHHGYFYTRHLGTNTEDYGFVLTKGKIGVFSITATNKDDLLTMIQNF